MLVGLDRSEVTGLTLHHTIHTIELDRDIFQRIMAMETRVVEVVIAGRVLVSSNSPHKFEDRVVELDMTSDLL